MPEGEDAGHAVLARIFLGFARDLARGVVTRCPQCGRLFALTPKQSARLREPGRRAYCSDECRITFIESSEERKAQKIAAAKRSRKKRQKTRRGVR